MSKKENNRQRQAFGSAILLAGGESRRMGFDKQTITRTNEPLAHEMIKKLKAHFADIIVSTNAPSFYDVFEHDAQVQTIVDVLPGHGPLSGLHACLPATKSQFVFVIACDMPHFNETFLALLKEKLMASREYDGIVTRLDSGFIEPFMGFYDRHLQNDITIAIEKGYRSLQRFCEAHNFLYLSEFEARSASPDLRVFQNLNRPEDVARWRADPSRYNHPKDKQHKEETMHPPEDDAIRQKYKQITHQVPITRITKEDSFPRNDIVIDEATLTLSVLRESESSAFVQDGHTHSDLEPSGAVTSVHAFSLCADRLDDFLIGWLYSSGFIQDQKDILGMKIEQEEGSAWFAEVKLASAVNATTGAVMTPHSLIAIPKPASWFFSAFAQQDRDGELFKLTGASHVLGLYDWQGNRLDLVEDISRHVAFDKLIGRAVKNEVNLGECMLLASCRLTGSIVLKGIVSGLPLLASRAAVSSRALDLAKQHNVRLLGFVRHGRMNTYV